MKLEVCCMLICTAFKSYMGCINAQHVSSPTSMKLPTTAGTFRSLNYFGYAVYVQWISTYQNIAKNFTPQSQPISQMISQIKPGISKTGKVLYGNINIQDKNQIRFCKFIFNKHTHTLLIIIAIQNLNYSFYK